MWPVQAVNASELRGGWWEAEINVDTAPRDSPYGRVLLRDGSGIRDAKERQEFLQLPVEQQVRDG